MDIALLNARILLALVFVVAGIAKLADRTGTRRAMAQFGVPGALVATLGLLLPLAELAVAIALIPRATAWFGAVGALLLLLAFSGGIAGNLARGNRPDCHCFGSLYSEPAGWRTLARNVVLAAVAVSIVARGREGVGSSVMNWTDQGTTSSIIASIAVGSTLALLMLAAWLYRENRRLREQLEASEMGDGTVEPVGGPQLGSPAPPFELADLAGNRFTLDTLRAGGLPIMLLFAEPNCFACRALLPHVAEWQQRLAGDLTLAVVSSGTVEANRKRASELGLTRVLLQRDHEVDDAYDVSGTPSAVLINPDGTIGSSMANGGEAIQALLSRTLGRSVSDAAAAGGNGHRTMPIPAPPVKVDVGRQAPRLQLPDLDGNVVELATVQGQPTLVLFWRPDCHHSQRMLADVKAWEANPPVGAPRLLVISTGSIDENRSAGFQAPVIVDAAYETPRLFGARGTPSAVLINGQGQFASSVVVGRQAILALAATPVPSESAMV